MIEIKVKTYRPTHYKSAIADTLDQLTSGKIDKDTACTAIDFLVKNALAEEKPAGKIPCNNTLR